jgi:hypothetical protein
MFFRSFRLLLTTLLLLATAAVSFAQVGVGVSVSFGPPALPIYAQPPLPGPGYLWTPGYWAYDVDGGYYWVPGTWVLPPQPGFLWTPGYWAWGGSEFFFHVGFWGPTIGFYGGINYGFGYFGHGFVGGRWENGEFFYNRAVTNVDVTNIHNVYNTTVTNNTENHVSYNGGEGGISDRPTAEEQAAENERHVPPVAAQTQQEDAARSNPQQRASVNQGKPQVAATSKPGELSGAGVEQARAAGAPYKPPANNGVAGGGMRPAENGARPEESVPRTNSAIHPNDLPPAERPSPPNTGNPGLDKKYQQQQEKLQAQQDKERQQLQKKQDQEHQKMAGQKANDANTQQMEQRHQQQTQQLEQKHTQQQQQLQQKQQRSTPTGESGKPRP